MSHQGHHKQHRMAMRPIHKTITTSSQVFICSSLLTFCLPPEFYKTTTQQQEQTMSSQNQKANPSTIGNLVPGFAFYEGIGGSLAELLVDFFEAIADLAGKFRA